MAKPLEGLRVAVLATDGFEEAELKEPVEALEEQGANVEIIAPHLGMIQAFHHHDKAGKVKVDRTLDQVKPDDYDAVLLPGGALNADTLRVHPQAQAFVQEMQNNKKPMAIICHAPWILISAELVENRKLTSYHTIQDDLKNAGANWVDQEVVIDDNWVTSRQPSDIPAFNRAFIEQLEKVRTKKARAA